MLSIETKSLNVNNKEHFWEFGILHWLRTASIEK